MTHKRLFRLAHLSDLHFSKLTWSPSQFFSKRWLGNLNLLLARKHAFDQEGLLDLLPILRQQNVDAILITGDLSSTSLKEEFLLARQFIQQLQDQKFKVFTLPGNHDHYTQSAYANKLFYEFFDSTYSSSEKTPPFFNLKEDKITVASLGHNWWLVALDTALATSILSSNGHFSASLEKKLKKTLEELPKNDSVILMNHFPLFANESKRKRLIGREALQEILKSFPQVKLYLHGHSHRHCIADLRASHLPIILDSGSTAQKHAGTWNLIDINSDGCTIEVFKNTRNNRRPFWQSVGQSQFTW